MRKKINRFVDDVSISSYMGCAIRVEWKDGAIVSVTAEFPGTGLPVMKIYMIPLTASSRPVAKDHGKTHATECRHSQNRPRCQCADPKLIVIQNAQSRNREKNPRKVKCRQTPYDDQSQKYGRNE